MKNFLNRLDAEALSLLRRIGVLAQARELQVYVVGGCVRDMVLKRRIVDLDVVVEGDGIALARQFAAAVSGKLTAYAQFGTATVKLADGRAVDFVSARKEKYLSPGALPVVTRGSIHDDLFRRDFTVNAMAMSISPDSFGALVDDFKGYSDIKKKVIRVLHALSFSDDPTRILRSVRFEQRFGFHIEPKTLRLLKSAVKSKAEATVKPPRFFEEFKKNIQEDQALQNLKRLESLGVLRFLGCPVKIDGDKARLIAKISVNGSWAKKHLADWTKSNIWLVHLMAIFDGASPVAVEKALQRFQCSNADRKKIISSLSLRAVFDRLAEHRLSSAQAFELLRNLSIEEILWMRSQTTAAAVRRRLDQYLLKWRYLKLQINGEDLKAAGIKPGREFQIVLGKVLFALVEGKCTTRAEQLNYVRSLCQNKE